jgi:Arc/MetJ-type ribon-helix-helix transcriptional regulator
MTTAKVALSIPEGVLREAKKQVAKGRAKSLSSFVSEALDDKLRRDELEGILDALDLEHGKPSKEAMRWAKNVLRPSSSTRAR